MFKNAGFFTLFLDGRTEDTMNLENKKQFVVILIAIGLGLVAAFLTSQYVQNNIKAQTKALARDYGKQNAGFAKEIETLRSEVKRQRDEIKQLETKQSQYKPGVAAQATTEKVQPVVQMDSFSVRTPPGKRAVTILVDSLSAVGGLINPGDFVDIIGEIKIPEESGDAKSVKDVTTVLFKNIQVLAVGTNFKPLGSAPAYEAQQKARSLNITVAISPEESGLIAFAQANGKLQLTLRPPTDGGLQLLQVASWDTLAEYVMDHQGTELMVPQKQANIFEADDQEKDEVRPYIQIFKSGAESNF